MDEQAGTPPTPEELRSAAIEHASIPPDQRTAENDPLLRLLPDDANVTLRMRGIIEEATGASLYTEAERLDDAHGCYFAPRAWERTARARARLTRWAMKKHYDTIREVRGDVEARGQTR